MHLKDIFHFEWFKCIKTIYLPIKNVYKPKNKVQKTLSRNVSIKKYRFRIIQNETNKLFLIKSQVQNGFMVTGFNHFINFSVKINLHAVYKKIKTKTVLKNGVGRFNIHILYIFEIHLLIVKTVRSVNQGAKLEFYKQY